MRKGFIFYRDRCVGCEACVVACGLENGPFPPLSWRNIYHFNENHLPGVPVFSWSLACNHCEEAACMLACPASAYFRDPETGAVILNEDLCIGCTYCQWACPYDAPVFNVYSGIMSKCTLCIHRLQEGSDPACVNGCPVGALQFDSLPEKNDKKQPPGFPETTLNPAVRIIYGKHTVTPETTYIYKIPPGKGHSDKISGSLGKKKNLSPGKEWPLLIFTLLLPLMAGMLARYMFRPEVWLGYAFPAAGVFSGVASLWHLGRKERAWRSVLNIRTSWLSREIMGFTLTFIAGIVFFIFPRSMFLAWIALSLAVVSLVAVDQVYAYAKNKYTFLFHSSNVLLTGFLWISLAWLQARPVIFIGVLKLLLTAIAVIVLYRHERMPVAKIIMYAMRILTLVIALVYLISGPAYLPYVVVLFLTGEIIDRLLFYIEQELTGMASHFAGWQKDHVKQKMIPSKTLLP
ncbi:MAG: dimethyl sulfoxide reductase anchor subunit [Chlorobi bacterium]|nr:dimethyl sulfoxide reductase anchor subunit [Chlorobiota bacterium]